MALRAVSCGFVCTGAVALATPAHAAPAGKIAPLLSLCLATGPDVSPDTIWQSWSFPPEIALPLAALAVWHVRTAWHVREAGEVREPKIALRSLNFSCGWLLLAAALTSPLCRAAASLAWAHMIQHVILVAAAPPLLILGAPWIAAHLGPSRLLRRPLPVGALYAAAIWVAHAPAIYQAALRDPVAHLALTTVLVYAGLLFWAAFLPRADAEAPETTLDPHAAGIVLGFGAMAQTSLLGALLTLAHAPWYPVFADRAVLWGLSPLADQQLAGAIMWVPMNAIYLMAALALCLRWMRGGRWTGTVSADLGGAPVWRVGSTRMP